MAASNVDRQKFVSQEFCLARSWDLGPAFRTRWRIGSILYEAVIALLTDLLGSKSQDIALDDWTGSLIGELSQHLDQLEITGMRLTRNNLSG